MKNLSSYLAFPCLLVVLLTSCRNIDITEPITLRNESGTQYHMFISSESFDSSNRLETGESRTVFVSEAQTIGGEITAAIGRNQIQEATVTCNLLIPAANGPDIFLGATVTWDGVNATCVTE